VRETNKLSSANAQKTISIFKLELNATLLCARLLGVVHSTLEANIRRRKLVTDSSTFQNCIWATAAYYQIFVSNRVCEIQTSTQLEKWRFIPGKLNPADLATCFSLEEQPIPTW
jgi:hypothetical protein